ncbi:hypothetical protein J6590_003332 [Homalodisca vitripennis]|nr:hypothetical protein J6590_003332 [Homalodisca vitripennis]
MLNGNVCRSNKCHHQKLTCLIRDYYKRVETCLAVSLVTNDLSHMGRSTPQFGNKEQRTPGLVQEVELSRAGGPWRNETPGQYISARVSSAATLQHDRPPGNSIISYF